MDSVKISVVHHEGSEEEEKCDKAVTVCFNEKKIILVLPGNESERESKRETERS